MAQYQETKREPVVSIRHSGRKFSVTNKINLLFISQAPFCFVTAEIKPSVKHGVKVRLYCLNI